MKTIYEAQDANGEWHEITGFQYAALKLEGAVVRTRVE